MEFEAYFPQLIPSDSVKLECEVKKILGFDDFKDLKLGEVTMRGCRSGTLLLRDFSISTGISLM